MLNTANGTRGGPTQCCNYVTSFDKQALVLRVGCDGSLGMATHYGLNCPEI